MHLETAGYIKTAYRICPLMIGSSFSAHFNYLPGTRILQATPQVHIDKARLYHIFYRLSWHPVISHSRVAIMHGFTIMTILRFNAVYATQASTSRYILQDDLKSLPDDILHSISSVRIWPFRTVSASRGCLLVFETLCLTPISSPPNFFNISGGKRAFLPPSTSSRLNLVALQKLLGIY